jgi:arylsulfatase A-like enzyme
VRNIDVAPTILGLLDVTPAATVQGRPIDLCGERDR